MCREIINEPPRFVDGFGATLCERVKTGQKRLLSDQFPFALCVLVETHECEARLIEGRSDFFQKVLILADTVQEDDYKEPLTRTFHRHGNQGGYLFALVSVEGEFGDRVALFR
jgi:hypothetical protein